MGVFEQAYDSDNLSRAWRWIRSNPDHAYKGYFRRLYRDYAFADTALLSDLHDRLKRGLYEPAHSCKLYFPKPSGVLRPYTLLTVEDQIVYQALVNVVAEKLVPKVRSRYLVETFGHLYAGKASVWFYRKWQDCYKRYNEATCKAVAEGFGYAARFDLTAFYDSLDHRVLRHFLEKIGCDRDFCKTLTDWLSHWTATKKRIYHHHGIPQGPLASGLLSEVVLQHLDRNHRSPNNVRYFRYVDDIRLFSRSEKELRRMLGKLDLLSKDVGLFPQTSKIDIHIVTDIEAELKTISQEVAAIWDDDEKLVNQDLLRRKVVAVSSRYRVNDSTKFKFLLARARPTARLNERLWRIMEGHPELYSHILWYFQRYKRLPQKVGERLVRELKAQPLYGAVTAELIRTAEGRLPSGLMRKVDQYVRSNWKPRSLPADLLAALGRWGIERSVLSLEQVGRAVSGIQEWWTRAELVAALGEGEISKASMEGLFNAKLGDRVSDVAKAAAVNLAQQGLVVTIPRKSIQLAASRVLEAFGLLPCGSAQVCGIEVSVTRMLGRSVTGIDWRIVFGSNYGAAERQALWCRALAETDITTWVNAMDVFNDWLLIGLYNHDSSLGTYNAGSIGSVMCSTKLQLKYPSILAMVKAMHEKRSESSLSHAWTRKGGKLTRPTGFIKFSYFRKAKKLIHSALAELAAKW